MSPEEGRIRNFWLQFLNIILTEQKKIEIIHPVGWSSYTLKVEKNKKEHSSYRPLQPVPPKSQLELPHKT